jgi:hypothetical protein
MKPTTPILVAIAAISLAFMYCFGVQTVLYIIFALSLCSGLLTGYMKHVRK